MQKKPLKVQPARRVYKPKYPSYEDKNPLLYPETRPYPFSHKFIKWASTGGLASIMLFSGNTASAQTEKDTLYNTFPLENAGVPYHPVMFGTGLPERLSSEESIQAIRKAFADSGIKLDKKVWLENSDVGVYLDGYSHEDKIGFVFMDYKNMDASFISKNAHYPRDRKTYELASTIKNFDEKVAKEFLKFIEDKAKFIERFVREKASENEKNYANQLSALEPQKENEALFKTYYLEFHLNQYRKNYKDKKDLIKKIAEHLEYRFEDSVEKYICYGYAHSFHKPKNISDEFYKEIEVAFEKITALKSDKKFLENYFILNKFYGYNKGSWHIVKDSTYQALKLDIVQSHPIEKWFDNTAALDHYCNQHTISLEEAERIDKHNKKGSQFTAIISSRDPHTIVPDDYSLSENLRKKQTELYEEYNLKNGMTEEILAQKKAALYEVRQRYNERIKTSSEEIKSLLNTRQQEIEVINQRYKDMELLTDEEQAEFQVKFDNLRQEQIEWKKNNKEEIRMETLRRLEGQVKVYIQWAKSQMGG